MERPLERALAEELREREASGLRRQLEPLPRGRVDLTSNDTLGLARHPVLAAAAAEAAREHGAGARASRLLGGGSALDAELEAALAEWLRAEAALLFPTGFQANLGLLGTLARPGDVVLSDALNHASLIDGARLSRATTRVFAHRDVEHARALLAAERGARRRLVVTEGVFSMDGDRAPLAELHALCVAHDAWLVVDEAHATGVIGPEGAGAWAAARAEGCGDERLAARVVTGGKALGVAGGLVAGSSGLRDALVQHARSFVYTTGTSPAVAGALLAAVGMARGMDAERAHLLRLARLLAAELGLPEPAAAVVPIPVGDSARALELAATLREEGFELRAVRPPTVPEGGARLRACVHADHQEEDVRALAALVKAKLARLPATPPPPCRARAPLFVVGTDTGIGKTVVAALLARAFAARGPTTYWKPVQTGGDSDTATVERLAAGPGVRLATPAHEFPLPASPHEAAAAADGAVDAARLDAELARLRAETADGALVVELAGGLLVPYDDARTQADWLAEQRPRIVLVARSGLGTLNHTLLTLEALRARRLAVEALFLVGPLHDSNRETLRARGGVPALFELPPLEPLDADALDAWLARNPLDRLLDRP